MTHADKVYAHRLTVLRVDATVEALRCNESNCENPRRF